METAPQVDVLIAGGGMVGLALACALGRAGLAVTVAEQVAPAAQQAPAFDGRVSAIALGSKRLLEAVGAWDGMARQAQPIWDIRVSDGDSPFVLDYHHAEVGAEPFGWIVENRHTRAALMAAVERLETVRILAPATVVEYTAAPGHAQVRLNDGTPLRARLLVAADGKNSALREMAGINAVTSEYRQTAIVCTIAHTLPHRGLAQERFLPAGPFAVLPMQEQRSSLVWTEKSEDAPMFLRLPEEDFVQEIRERVGDSLGDISTTGPRFAYPLSFLLAARYGAERLCLLGDAAHAIHPIAGQGVNLGFRDVAVLAELVTERARLGLDIGDAAVLAHYQRWRRFDNTAMLAVTDGLNRLFSSTAPPFALARGLGLWAVAHLPPAKRLFMRHAMGLTGDVPRLMREAL